MNDDLEPEYDFDYENAKPNRFAAKLKKGGRLVVLDPEVAAEYTESAAVNAARASSGQGTCDTPDWPIRRRTYSRAYRENV